MKNEENLDSRNHISLNINLKGSIAERKVGEVGMKCGYCKKWFENSDYKHWNNCRIKFNEQRRTT